MTLIIVDPHYLHILYLQIRLQAKICNPTSNTHVLLKSFVDTSNTMENTSCCAYSQLKLNKVTHCLLVSALINKCLFHSLCHINATFFAFLCLFFFFFWFISWFKMTPKLNAKGLSIAPKHKKTDVFCRENVF